MAVKDAFVIGRQASLTFAQAIVLMDLSDHPRQRMSTLASSLGISRSACTQIVGSLVKKSFLERSANDADRRVVYVDLTASGRALVERIEALGESGH